MEYIAFMHKNTATNPTPDEGEAFFQIARASGLFRGGSAIGSRQTVGGGEVPDLTDNIDGYMRFESDSYEALVRLLESHPVFTNGGTIELCELPKT